MMVDGLKEYQLRRLDLADMIRAMVYIARERHDEQAENQARQLLVRLAEDRFTLAVVGQFSRGKSTLMNAILGAEYLPIGVLPMTSVITTVRYGSRPRATYLRHGQSLPAEVPLAQVPALIAQSSAQRAELQVASVTIEVPADLLRLGIAFVDTPGVGSAIGVNTATTNQFLPQADAVIFVMGFDSALTEAEAGFLAEVGRHAGTLFLVVNKRDLVSEDAAAEVLSRVRQTLLDDQHLGATGVFVVSALQALEGRIRPDDALLEPSGLLAFEAALTAFLTTEKSKLFLRNLATRTANLLSRQRCDLRLGRLALDGGLDPDTVAAAFQARIGELRAEQRAVVSDIADRIGTELPARLEARSAAWRDDLSRRLTPLIEGIQTMDLPAKPGESPREALRDRVDEAGGEILPDWLRRCAAEVTEVLIDLVPDQIGRLLTLAGTADTVGANLAGLSAADDTADAAGWRAEDVPTVSAPPVTWSVVLESSYRPHLRSATRESELRRRLPAAIDAAVTAAVSQAREGFVERAREWVRRLAEEADKRTSAASARFEQNLRTIPSDENLKALDDLWVRLAGLRQALDSGNPRSAEGGDEKETGKQTGEAHGETRRAVPCAVCARLEETLVDSLRLRQFRLATREHDQDVHARAGGFCPLHTWEYYAMASPLGVSAGYARLAETVAGSLDALHEQSANVDDLVRGVRDLATEAERCPVCAALAESERVAIADLAAASPSGADEPALCLRHVALVLAAGPTTERAHTLVHALSGRLRRNSEDMRAYALKREALQRGLITEEETRAHLETLRLLAGEAALARPWFEDEVRRPG